MADNNSQGFDLTQLTNASTLQAGVMTVIRLIIVISGGFATVIGLIGHGDLEGLYAFFAANEGLVFLTALITAGTFGYGVYVSIQRHQKIAAAQAAARQGKL